MQVDTNVAEADVGKLSEGLEPAQERLRLAEGRYRVGSRSTSELDDAQVAQTSAAAQRVQAIFASATARAADQRPRRR